MILTPLEEEARCILSGLLPVLKKQGRLVQRERGEVFSRGLFRLRVVGMGPPDQEDAEMLSSLNGDDIVLLAGFGGGLSMHAQRGSVLFLSSISTLSKGDTEPLPLCSVLELPFSAGLGEMLGFPLGKGLSILKIAGSPHEKKELFRLTGSDVCDMETGLWEQAIRSRGCQFVAARAISDAVDETLPEFLGDLVQKNGKLSFPRLLRSILSPPKLLALIQVGLSQRVARKGLADLGKRVGCFLLEKSGGERGKGAVQSFLALSAFIFFLLIDPFTSYAIPVPPPASSSGPPGTGPFLNPGNAESFPQLPIGVPSPFSFTSPTQNTVVIPLPAIGVSYNTGVTVGTIIPILSALPSGRITSILAPSITYNPYLGTQLGARYYRYYKGNLKRWHLIGLQSNSIWNFYEFHYRDLSMGDGRYILDIRLKDFKNPAARFYGLGPDSSFGNQTNYTLSEASAHVTVGANLDHQKIRAWFMERLREYGASPGVIPGMPYSGTLFPSVNGISNSPVIISHRVNLTYDTRDNHLIPSTGTYARAFAELDQNETAGEVSVFDRFNAEYKTWIPQGDNDQNVLAIRGMVNLMNGPNIPFYAQSMLGGAYTLEGFGTGRFYDLDAALFNMEERIQAFDMTLLGVTSSWQIAPFLGVGEVFHDQRELMNPSLYAINPGVGFRALVEPNVVGRLDMGYSTQAGVVEFVGIGFPF